MKNPFRMPTPKETAERELRETELHLLKAKSALEHYTAQVQMLEARRQRLREHLADGILLTSIPRSLVKVAA